MSPSAAIVQVLWSSSVSDRKTSTQSLYSMWNGTGSQWRTSWRSGVMWSYFLLLQTSLAAALRLESAQESGRRAGEWAVKTELVKVTANRPCNMAPHGQVRLQQDAEIVQRGRGPYHQLFPAIVGHFVYKIVKNVSSSPVSRWIHRLRVTHHRLLS